MNSARLGVWGTISSILRHKTIRGNPENNDSYGTLQVTVSKVVRGSSRFRDFTYGKRRRTVKRKAPKPGNRGIGRGRAKF